MSRRFLCLVSAAAILVAARSTHAGDPSLDQLTFTGSSAKGTTSITFLNGVYSFQFVGDEVLTYKLDLNDVKVKGGQIIVNEVTSASRPIDGGGFIYRDLNGAYWFPGDLYKKTGLVTHSVAGNTVTIDYALVFNGTHPLRYQYTLDQKVLRVRVIDPLNNLSVLNNFSGLTFGKTTGVESPKTVHMQGALAQPLVLFRNGALHYFTANMLDLFQSNASDYGIVDTFHPTFGADWINLNFDTVTLYKPMSNNQLAAPLDDTYIVVVSAKVKDVLLTSTAPRSPYHSMLSTRMFFDAPETKWSYYSGMFDLYQSLGMYNLAGYFFNWSSSALDPPTQQNAGPDWTPATDPVNFSAMVKKGVATGALLGAYTAYNCLPPTAPGNVQNQANLARDGSGMTKPYLQTGFPLLTVEASGEQALIESTALKAVGCNAAYLDIHTYGSLSKGPDGDHLDQTAGSSWAKTNRQAFVAQKKWFESLRSVAEGPMMGEGSIATANSNMEFLWFGYTDSVQRVINSGAGKQSIQLPANSPDAPTNWPIIPEYEWRVAAPNQVNHGNGFYDRFFHVGDGPTIVNSAKQIVMPLSQDGRDIYNAMELAYGHAGFVITNGTQSLTQGYLTHPAAADTYFMTNALQPFRYNSPVIGIYYYYQGAFKTFEQVIFATETTDTFRKIPILIVFESGLKIYVNCGTTALSIVEAGVPYTLPAKSGWLAHLPGWILAFSAIPPNTGNQRIDYCDAVGQYEYMNGRGKVTSYGSLTNLAKGIQYKVHPTNLTVTEDANGLLQLSPGAPPALTKVLALAMSPPLKVGERLGGRAFALYSNAAFRDVTTLVTWSSSNPAVATVNASGVITAKAPGQVVISPSSMGSPSVMPVTIKVQ